MIIGTFFLPQVDEESECRSTKEYYFTEVGDYHIHSMALMPNIPFEESQILPYEIDHSLFVNDEETKLTFEDEIDCQNYLTCQYIGRAPLEFYEEGNRTEIGRRFRLVCRGGDPAYDYRAFGTKDAIEGYNRDANENVSYRKDEA